ncbi:hypothetical protein VRRI112168_02100 [Vreelandella rituensis]|uniref:Uncharacterized protein n=1 Tax=Vreelandella rituensis TaxID=2282306 RepID=A0A368U782_9GAMM|nr:hypothetical protein [Halomonas rituensis]RCV92297.1 hypothetical protein DU506_08510 [Halomonas rituensis]
MKLNKLAVGISVASAMILGISQVQAFDNVKWKWNLDVDTDIDQYIDIKVENAEELAVIEVDQTFDGSLKAVSIVKDIDNDGLGLKELGNVVSNATAVANNASLTTDVMTNIDVNQDWDGSGSILASSYVKGVDNMTVDSVATAVANNLSVALSPNDDGSSILLANIVQDGVGDVSAYSTVKDVNINVKASNGFEGPHVNSVATAVGNNVSVNMGSVSN